MSRAEFPVSVKTAAWKRCKKRCEGCTARLVPGKFDYDHIRADGLGGEPTLENCQVLCTSCHYTKTHHEDRPIMSKADKMMKKQAAGIKTKSGRGFQKAPPGYNHWKRRIEQ